MLFPSRLSQNRRRSSSTSLAGTSIVCQTCGDKGFSEFLTSCIKCRISAKHRYCLDKLPEEADKEVIWTCDECTPKDVKVDTSLFRKSQRISLIKEKTEARKKMKRPYRNPPIVPIKAGVTGLAELTHLTDEFSNQNENVPRLTSVSENNGKQDIKRQRRLILSEEADEKFELSKVAASRATRGLTSISENNEKQEMKRERGLILSEEADNKFESSKAASLRSTHDSYDDSSDNSCCHLSVESMICIRGEPVNERIWRGHFNVRNHTKGFVLKLAAHLSNLACPKVIDVAGKLPKVLNLDILPKDDVWPKCFGNTTPTDQSIALYFLPEYEKEENDFELLLEDMINGDLAMKTVVDNAQLMIFTSRELTTEHWRLESKYYLWAVFQKNRRKSLLSTNMAIVPLLANNL